MSDPPQPPQALLEAHFVLPQDPPPVAAPSKQTAPAAHIDALWSQLSRTTTSAPRINVPEGEETAW